MPSRDLDHPAYAGGCLIFIGFLVGAIVGIAEGQPSAGTLVGTGGGAALALLLWLLASRRR